MWMAMIGVLALAVAGIIAVALYAVHRDYTLGPKAATPRKKTPAAEKPAELPAWDQQVAR
jgi:hypothetical protein